ncbi:MAG TPA: hypothetical protein VHH33_01160 [Nitrososphaeraceae archaeon]|jgi:uncharacterized protein YacL|nr:hypothetical protein [Nitrososphaeraceae archaeon]
MNKIENDIGYVKLAKTKLQTMLIVAMMVVGLFVGISLLDSLINISASTQKNITNNESTRNH